MRRKSIAFALARSTVARSRAIPQTRASLPSPHATETRCSSGAPARFCKTTTTGYSNVGDGGSRGRRSGRDLILGGAEHFLSFNLLLVPMTCLSITTELALRHSPSSRVTAGGRRRGTSHAVMRVRFLALRDSRRVDVRSASVVPLAKRRP